MEFKNKVNEYNKTETDTGTENKLVDTSGGRGETGNRFKTRYKSDINEIQESNVQHKEYSQYFMTTLNALVESKKYQIILLYTRNKRNIVNQLNAI